MKEKLSRIKSPWRRLLISSVINCLVAFEQVRSPRRRVHWIGSHNRPRRLERAFFIIVLFAAMLTFDPHQYVVWSTIWGTFFAFTVNFYLVLRLLPRKSYQRGSNYAS